MRSSGKRPLARGLPRVHLQAGVVRWLLLGIAGAALLGVALAGALSAIQGSSAMPRGLALVTLQHLPPWARALIWALLGAALLTVALVRLLRDAPALGHIGATALLPEERLPRIVAVGGGHGLSTLLRGLKNQPVQLTAIVTVADDGGSSGILRRETGMLPPGDARNCLVALAQAEPLMTQLFEYRFGHGAGLDGHAFGNLFIAAMAGIAGSFEGAIAQASRVLAVRGRILPSTLQNVTLCGEVRGGTHAPNADALTTVYGESAITEADGVVERVYLQPDDAHGYPEAIRALLEADLIVLGPGSLFTSVLPNLLVPDIRAAITASAALKVFACNVATQPGETDGFSVGDHMRALATHLGSGFCHYVLANGNQDVELPAGSGSTLVGTDFCGGDGCELVLANVVDADLPWRHDADKLAAAIMRLYEAHKPAAGDA